ncbi:hypothetical protein AVW15_04420 [Chelatococcus daeguensis]|nr:hypothetical protein AVW15_04420 [Chelatococcus daeguensis]
MHLDEAVHALEGGFRPCDHAAFLGFRQCDAVERGREGAPVQAAAVGMAGEMARAERLRQADPRRRLEEECGTEVGAFGDIEPAERRRQVRARAEGRRRRDLWHCPAEIDDVLLDLCQASPAGEIGQKGIERRVRIERVDVAVEGMLHRKEATVIDAVGKGRTGHDALVQCLVRRERAGLETFRPSAHRHDLRGRPFHHVHGQIPVAVHIHQDVRLAADGGHVVGKRHRVMFAPFT